MGANNLNLLRSLGRKIFVPPAGLRQRPYVDPQRIPDELDETVHFLIELLIFPCEQRFPPVPMV